jgi:hypothetical protein
LTLSKSTCNVGSTVAVGAAVGCCGTNKLQAKIKALIIATERKKRIGRWMCGASAFEGISVSWVACNLEVDFFIVYFRIYHEVDFIIADNLKKRQSFSK